MIYLGADHRGFELKAKIAKWLAGRGFEFRDMGAFEHDQEDDYVDFAILVAEQVRQDPDKHRGIVLCGSGVGVDIAANKVSGIRCGLGFAPDQAHAARRDDDINVLAIASDNVDLEQALKIVEQFLTTEHLTTERYERRIGKIARLEALKNSTL